MHASLFELEDWIETNLFAPEIIPASKPAGPRSILCILFCCCCCSHDRGRNCENKYGPTFLVWKRLFKPVILWLLENKIFYKVFVLLLFLIGVEIVRRNALMFHKCGCKPCANFESFLILFSLRKRYKEEVIYSCSMHHKCTQKWIVMCRSGNLLWILSLHIICENTRDHNFAREVKLIIFVEKALRIRNQTPPRQ